MMVATGDGKLRARVIAERTWADEVRRTSESREAVTEVIMGGNLVPRVAVTVLTHLPYDVAHVDGKRRVR
jgi:hypothetical protein